LTTDETKLLTKIGYLVLRQMGCYQIATELYLHHREYNWETAGQKDCHSIIDILGVEREWGSPPRDILRGVEVKVSKSDLAKGFIQNGCTFHYLLIPKGLIPPSKVNRDIGIIEVDIPNFRYFVPESYEFLHGVKLTRKAKRKEAQETTIQKCKEQVAGRLTTQVVQWIASELRQEKEKEKAQV
jgi:hypothetical protein